METTHIGSQHSATNPGMQPLQVIMRHAWFARRPSPSKKLSGFTWAANLRAVWLREGTILRLVSKENPKGMAILGVRLFKIYPVEIV